ncbi:MAG: restriction endonuclease [Balneolaceae bacterium]
MASIIITKASGEVEPFDENKLRRSLSSSGANKQVVDHILRSVNGILYDGITTQKIYKEAFRLLKNHSYGSAGRYKLKEALLELGPTGHPFEKFVGELLNRMGYKTKVGVVVEGDCVSHEIDVIAEKDNEHFMIECKFHNRKGHTCNVKVPLYIHSRFLDVKTKWSSLPNHKHKNHQGWVVTNTRFTSDALQYGNCVGLKMLSWDYPKREGLKDLIDRVNLHPITSLSTISKKVKKQLLDSDVIFCMQLCEDEKILNSLGLDDRKKKQVVKEAHDICSFKSKG